MDASLVPLARADAEPLWQTQLKRLRAEFERCASSPIRCLLIHIEPPVLTPDPKWKTDEHGTLLKVDYPTGVAQRTIRLKGRNPGRDAFLHLAEKAGRCLLAAPTSMIEPITLAVSDDAGRWILWLFELANRTGSLIPAHTEALTSTRRQLDRAFGSRLRNVALDSAAAIDLVLQAAEVDRIAMAAMNAQSASSMAAFDKLQKIAVLKGTLAGRLQHLPREITSITEPIASAFFAAYCLQQIALLIGDRLPAAQQLDDELLRGVRELAGRFGRLVEASNHLDRVFAGTGRHHGDAYKYAIDAALMIVDGPGRMPIDPAHLVNRWSTIYRWATSPRPIVETTIDGMLAEAASAAKVSQREETGGGDDEDFTSNSLEELLPCEAQAYAEYLAACRALSPNDEDALPIDKEAFNWVKENEPSGKSVTVSLESWKRYVRAGREAAGTQKNRPRLGRTGRSMTFASELDTPPEEKADS